VLIYPNPNRGIFTLKRENQNIGLLEVFDRTGMKIYEKEILDSGRINISNITKAGLYLVKITDQNTSQTSFSKIIIQK
jgi:hypothetical protein